MIEQTTLVETLLLGDTSALEDNEIHNLDNALYADQWFATDAETVVKALIDQKPVIISHFGLWVGEVH